MTRKCLECGTRFETELYNKLYCQKSCWGKSTKGWSTTAICMVCGNEFRTKPAYIKVGAGKTCSHKCAAVRKSQNASGAGHWNWKGGKEISKQGYVKVWIPDDHKYACMRAKTKKSVLEHRLVMAEALGRPLKDSEQVHHRDNNKQNNTLENLELRTGAHGNGGTNHCLTCTCV